MSEFELKLRVPPEQVDTLRQAFVLHGAQPQRLQAHYFDTAEGLLARNGMALRLRLEDGRWVQTLKTAGDGVVHREEHEVTVAGPAARLPALDPGLHADSAAGALLRAALAAAPHARLLEHLATDVLRLQVQLHTAGGTHVEAAFDIGEVRAGGRSSPVLEVELEHKAGPLQGVFDQAADWVRHGGLWLSTLTKAERGQRLLAATPQSPRRRQPQAAPVQQGMGGPVLMKHALLAVLEPLLAHAGDLADAQTAPETASETLHQVRIGLRKLRTVLRELSALAPGIGGGWDAVLAQASRALGLHRDHEVVSAAVRPLLQAAGAPVTTWAPPRQACDPAATVRHGDLQLTLLAVLALAHAQDSRLAPVPAAQARHLVAQQLQALQRRILRAARRFEALPLAAQHRVRKQLKRQRYLVELTAGLWPGRPTRQALKRMQAAQDALGRHHDTAVAMQAFRDHAAVQPQAWFAAGYLQGLLPTTARSAARALRKLNKSTPHWR